MVLSADAMGIRKGLSPIFCATCGNRIGWVDEYSDSIDSALFCDDCAKLPAEDEVE